MGLDGVIGPPVNKLYCSMISSSLSGDFEFQKEFDRNIQLYNRINGTNLPRYYQICIWLENEQMNRIQDRGIIDQIDKWKIIVDTIEKFYLMKMRQVSVENGRISKDKAFKLYEDFLKCCNLVRKNLDAKGNNAR